MSTASIPTPTITASRDWRRAPCRARARRDRRCRTSPPIAAPKRATDEIVGGRRRLPRRIAKSVERQLERLGQINELGLEARAGPARARHNALRESPQLCLERSRQRIGVERGHRGGRGRRGHGVTARVEEWCEETALDRSPRSRARSDVRDASRTLEAHASARAARDSARESPRGARARRGAENATPVPSRRRRTTSPSVFVTASTDASDTRTDRSASAPTRCKESSSTVTVVSPSSTRPTRATTTNL